MPRTQLRATRGFHELDLSGLLPAGLFSIPNPESDRNDE